MSRRPVRTALARRPPTSDSDTGRAVAGRAGSASLPLAVPGPGSVTVRPGVTQIHGHEPAKSETVAMTVPDRGRAAVRAKNPKKIPKGAPQPQP